MVPPVGPEAEQGHAGHHHQDITQLRQVLHLEQAGPGCVVAVSAREQIESGPAVTGAAPVPAARCQQSHRAPAAESRGVHGQLDQPVAQAAFGKDSGAGRGSGAEESSGAQQEPVREHGTARTCMRHVPVIGPRRRHLDSPLPRAIRFPASEPETADTPAHEHSPRAAPQGPRRRDRRAVGTGAAGSRHGRHGGLRAHPPARARHGRPDGQGVRPVRDLARGVRRPGRAPPVRGALHPLPPGSSRRR